MTEIVYAREPALSTEEFIALLHARASPNDTRWLIGRVSRKCCRTPTSSSPPADRVRSSGVSRAITDFVYACYLSNLAVDRTCQGQGIGRRLIEETRLAAGQEWMCLLLSAPDAIPFYRAIGMPQPDNAFLFKRER